MARPSKRPFFGVDKSTGEDTTTVMEVTVDDIDAPRFKQELMPAEEVIDTPEIRAALESSIDATINELTKPFFIALVLSDPNARLFAMHKSFDNSMTFPEAACEEPEDHEELIAAANKILNDFAGISVPTWERFARDEGTNTLYVRAYSKEVYDLRHICPKREGSMHLIPFDALVHDTPFLGKHVRWIATVSAHAPLMDYLLFKCPVD